MAGSKIEEKSVNLNVKDFIVNIIRQYVKNLFKGIEVKNLNESQH